MKQLLRQRWGFLIVFLPFTAMAQFNLDGQIIQRAEFRNGYNQPISPNKSAAKFIAQRARLQASYLVPHFSFYMSVQDVRTWGSTPQVKLSDTFLSVHEAWAETNLGEHWKVKLGRQELNYDNFRFLGNLDWALQGRAHDFGLVKYEKDLVKLHLGGGYNQDAQVLSGNSFSTLNQYKTAQMARYENQWDKLQVSVLFWNEGRQYQILGVNGEIEKTGIRHRQTLGIPTLRYNFKKTLLSAFYYYQMGKDIRGKSIRAFNLNVQATQQLDLNLEAQRKWRFTAGFEIISGTDQDEMSFNRSFSPLYGTNHLHNGYMDLFFVSGAHENQVGLEDYYLKARYDFGPKLFSQVDFHGFYSHGKVLHHNAPGSMNAFLGSEIDFSLGYLLNEAVSIQGGYSQFFHTDTYSSIQNRGELKNSQNWAYLMFIFRPTMKNKFIGILL